MLIETGPTRFSVNSLKDNKKNQFKNNFCISFSLMQVYGTPNPATPGGYGGPYTPNTPGGGMYGSEPSYSPYTQSPSPAGYGNPMTPGSIAPVSPAFNPLTPGAGMEETQADWVTTDIEVRINENHEVSLLFGDPFFVSAVCAN